MKKRKKSISEELHKAYWRGVTDVVGCIVVSMTFALMFAYAF